MKYFVFLFAVYLMVLSAIPCRSDDGCCMEETERMAAQDKQEAPVAMGDTDNKREHSQSPCSPLFACSTCHGFIVPMTFVLRKIFPPTLRKTFSVHYPGFAVSSFICFVWHPPLYIG